MEPMIRSGFASEFVDREYGNQRKGYIDKAHDNGLIHGCIVTKSKAFENSWCVIQYPR